MNESYHYNKTGLVKISVLFFFLITTSIANFTKAAGDPAKGEPLFKANCASCHHPDKKGTGPALRGVQARWEAAGIGADLYLWVKNPNAVISKGHAYVNDLLNEWKPKSGIMAAQGVSDEQIDDILAYIESYTEPVAANNNTSVVETNSKEESGSGWMWYVILLTIFLIIAISAGSVRRQLVNANRAQQGLEELPDESYWTIWKKWAWRNKYITTFVILVFLLGGTLDVWYRLLDIGVYENYKPEQPIKFSHQLHAGQNKIPCQYCHHTVEKSKHASIPSPMLCMNCHKAINNGPQYGKEEIAKIYKAVGYDPDEAQYIKDYQQQPIKWIKVHSLPDHVFFSHQQHVVAGKLDCKQCHGEMEKETVARIMPHEELNKIDGNIKIDRATLTMGWCIECHNKTEVKGIANEGKGNEYYAEMWQRLKKRPELLKKHLEDEKITVAELGGWECAKCHY
jgi:cytochrome c2